MRVVSEQLAAPLAARLVPIAVDAEPVACGRDLAHELREPESLFAADEEHRRDVGAVELSKDGRRALRVRAVVEAE